MKRTPLVVPPPLSLAEALGGSVPLQRLRESVRDSAARLDAVRPAIPRLLLTAVRAGPVDADGWSILASNAAVAAKLRQLRPRLEALLREAGWEVCSVRIKISAE